jgi:succinate-acetate transporter protein
MGWRGATGLNATMYAEIYLLSGNECQYFVCRGANYYFGGMLLIIAGILEFFLGNTFPTVVFLGTLLLSPTKLIILIA